MHIGAFAKACGASISAVRHYDSIGLLEPDYIDKFTGYRYYAPEQVEVFKRITALKKAGFSLKEIKSVLALPGGAVMRKMIASKKKQFETALQNLNILEKDLFGGKIMSATNINRKPGDDINVPFENDERMVGKWLVLGEFDEKEEFFKKGKGPTRRGDGDRKNEIYFLPNGEHYWVFGWTKGYVIQDNGDHSALCPYEYQEIDGVAHIFVTWKSYGYFTRGEKETILVMKQLDQKRYTKIGISRQDNIDIPFADDPHALGKWKAVCYCRRIEDFSPDKRRDDNYFSKLEFYEGGRCVGIYGGDIMDSPQHTWTKGYILRNWPGNQTACAYTFKIFDCKEYMFVEWKSGDYRWGGYDTDYYVFERDA